MRRAAAGVVIAGAFVLAGAVAGAGASQESKGPPTVAADLVGMETCATCHEDAVKAFKLTPHAKGEQSCETCHGPGKAHVDGDGDKTKIRSFQDADAAGILRRLHGLPQQGRPEALGRLVARREERRLRQLPQPASERRGPEGAARQAAAVELCTGCHLQKKAQLMRAGHMPMREGKLQCTSCHNPHGTPNDKMIIQTSVNQNCYTCHAEKRGPFLWEHAPVRENCLNCHDAHGTINDKMLKVKAPLLCQQCHQTSSHPGPAYPAQSRYAFNQGCLHCHPAIHGSVHPSGNRFFR